MSPTDRQKISADKPKESTLATFMARRTQPQVQTQATGLFQDSDKKVN